MEINKLIVPRNNGFWSIEVIRQKQGGWVEDCLICAPIDQKPTTPLLDSITVAECEGNKRLSIIFVGKDHISYEGGSDGYCQGAAHPWHVHYLKTASIDYSSGEGLPISAVLGSGANLALQTGAKRYFSRNPDDRLNPEPDATN